MRRYGPLRRRMLGLTLVEMVVTLVVMSVLAIGVTGFLTYGTRIYVEGHTWQQHLSSIRFASQRLSRELQHALPGTVEISGGCIAFRPVVAANRYLGLNQDELRGYPPQCWAGSDCTDCGGCTDLTLALLEGYRPHLAQLDQLDVSAGEATLAFSPSLPPLSQTEGQRYFLLDEAVTWCQVGESLERNGVLMGEGLINDLAVCNAEGADSSQCPFVMTAPGQTQNALVRTQWWVTDGDVSQRFSQEVQLVHVP